MFALAARNGLSVPYADVESLRRAYVFNNLQEFLDIYHQGTLVLRTEQDFFDMAWAYLERAAADNVLHAELFFDTQTHTGHGLDAGVVIGGLQRACVDAQLKLGMSASLILCFLRHLSEAEAFDALEQALPYRDKLVGIGLASSELGHPPEKFARVFAKARALGFRLVAHAGEEGPPAYIWSALDVLHVERIDHGVQAMQDRALVTRLMQDKVPLTVCPLSNLKLRVFPTVAQHNLGQMLDAGLVATVNSDDPAYFGGYINQNFTQTFAALRLGAQQAYQLALNSFEASFMKPSAKRLCVERLDAFFETFE
jgi:adenosine deaminase